jgi:flavin reductase (DIM6/NTAB) family NADH-FMN oxidoreductase RutF
MTKPSSFTPETDVWKFRTALGRFTTGITVITALTPDGPIGITANSFASVSLDPALVMWSPDKKSSRHNAFTDADAFIIHVLSAHQKAVCDAFVRNKGAFDKVPHHLTKEGIPRIDDCLAVFECHRFATHDAGDHTIILGKVHTAMEQPGDSLIFANGAFTTLNHTLPAI